MPKECVLPIFSKEEACLQVGDPGDTTELLVKSNFLPQPMADFLFESELVLPQKAYLHLVSKNQYSGLGRPKRGLLGKAWMILAGEVLARCFLTLSFETRENLFINNFIIKRSGFNPEHIQVLPLLTVYLVCQECSYNNQMSKDFFQRNIEVMNDLRTEQFKIKEYLQRGKYRMKQKFFNKGKKHYDFDLNSQEYFHEELYDVSFDNSEVQDGFNQAFLKLMQQPTRFRNQHQFCIEGLPRRKNQSEVRHQLYRFFNNRALDLQYEKYQIMERLHNINAEEEMVFVKSRISLIDKEIQMAQGRSDRLSCEDYFQETYTLGGKPVPVNQNGQSIYKYLDQQECWYSNIHRDDILVYTRNKLFRREIVSKVFLPIQYQHKFLVKTNGLDILLETEDELAKERVKSNEGALKQAKNLIGLFQQELQKLSPGNLIEKENITTFIYSSFGVQQNQLSLQLPLYPALYCQLLDSYNTVLPYFFRSLRMGDHRELIGLMPKFNNFCAIIFKYQNRQVLEGKQEVKLGLEDDIDIRKELHTMLEEVWVNKYVKTDFSRFDYRYHLCPVDWPLDTLTQEVNRQRTHKKDSRCQMLPDLPCKELIDLLKSTNYSTFRKHLKRRSEAIVARNLEKYTHMEQINKYNVLSNQEQTLKQLGELLRVKFNGQQVHPGSVLKESAAFFLNIILKNHHIVNPVEIEGQEMLRTVKIRQTRTKIISTLNAMRCYHRNLALDLRVISGIDFQFQLDDELLINSNKQAFQNFEKAVKDTQTYFSKESGDTQPLNLSQEEFVQHQTYSRGKLYKKDQVNSCFFGEAFPHVLVSHGRRLKNKILYDVVLEDIEEVERRILRVATNCINRYQRFLKVKGLEELVDRTELLSQLYELELQFNYQKFRLIEAYYYIYENVKEPLQAYKISQLIVNLIHKVPIVDLEQPSFVLSYRLGIEALKQETKMVSLMTLKLQTVENQKCKIFHDKFARVINIPLTLQAYLYGDIERKGKAIKQLQRMNSKSSKFSKESRGDIPMKVEEIKQNFAESDSEEEESFDLQNYDQYLLRKNMDAIFDDMIGGDEHGHVKEAAPVNTIALQNLVVNPKFEGGPHIRTKILPDLPITSQKRQGIVNFSDVLHLIGNIRHSIQKLGLEFESELGFCSTLYQLAAKKLLVKRMHQICLTPEALPPKWLSFETDDPYLEVVTRSMRYYQEVMAPCLQPPSNIQLAIPNTHQRHQQRLPVFGSLQYFDYHSIQSLIQLKKPVNSFRYRQHNIGLNFLQLLELEDKVWALQLERRGISQTYQNLGRHCQLSMQRSLTQYINTGQSEVFMATQQLKMYNVDVTKHLVYSDMIQQVRQYLVCQSSDLTVFSKWVQLSRYQLQDLLVMRYEIDRPFLNRRIDKTRILAPNDPKDIKKLKNRILSAVSSRGNEVLKQNCFLKFKAGLKQAFESRLKEINQIQYDSKIEGRERMSQSCISILTSKYRRHQQMLLLQSYSNDMMLTANKLLVGTQLCTLVQKLGFYVRSIPYLSKLFTLPTEDRLVDTKILYDQGKGKPIISLQSGAVTDGSMRRLYYIYTLPQLIQEWNDYCQSAVDLNMRQFNPNQSLPHLLPPLRKEQIFKWAFKIPDLTMDVTERDSLRYMLSVLHPFTGKLTQGSYSQAHFPMPQPPRNKFLVLLNYYRNLVNYIEANVLLISLQVDEDILDTVQMNIKKRINFEEKYALIDESSIRQTINSLENKDLSVVYDFVVNAAQMNRHVQRKMESKKYPQKKQHWAVHDEIIDFLMSKVQGFGLIRQSYLPLFDELKTLTQAKDPTELLNLRTTNIHKLILLSTYETHLNEINEQASDFYNYTDQLNQWLCYCPKKQKYSIQGDKNNRIDILKEISDNQDEKERFSNGIYVQNTNTLINRLKYAIAAPTIDIERFMRQEIYKNEIDENISSITHVANFLFKGMQCLRKLGVTNRLKLFARVRYHHDLSQLFISTRPSNISANDRQVSKLSLYDLLLGKKVLTLGCIAFSGKVKLPINARQFKDVYMELKEVNQIGTHNLYENLQSYREENKIQFSKADIALLGRNEGGNNDQHNHTIKQLLSFKLLREEFRFRISSQAIRILKAQRLPKIQPKRILNSSLIPRVHLISSYSSPLITERKTYISQQYKLSFLQAFINRFRNKVSRVDLLSSGYGFVITVPDLQDCVNYMNKLLFTFTEKQFKNRSETFSQYYEILIEAINDKNKIINEQAALIKYLQNKNNNLLEAEYLSKVTKLLHEKTLIEDKLHMVEVTVSGLEDRVHKAVHIQYASKINKLQKQNEELKQIFTRVKHLHMTNTKEAAKNDFLDVINYYKEKINDLLNKKVDFTITFDQQPLQNLPTKVTEQDSSDKYKSAGENQLYTTEDLQRCKLGEDILFDPYYTTKLINKMRLFNLFKMGSKRMKFSEDSYSKDQKMAQLHKIQDVVVAQSQREMLVRAELTKVQEELSKKCLQMDKIKQNLETIENQKTKLKILMLSKDKKIQQKERDLEELRKKIEEKQQVVPRVQKQKLPEFSQEAPKISAARKEKKYKKIDRTAFVTNLQPDSNYSSINAYQKFDMSNKDAIWRQKCQQLYIENKKLQAELERYQNSGNSIPSTPKRQGTSLNVRQKRDSLDSSGNGREHKFPNISFKYNMIKQGQF